jgi:hypothetical protein
MVATGLLARYDNNGAAPHTRKDNQSVCRLVQGFFFFFLFGGVGLNPH